PAGGALPPQRRPGALPHRSAPRTGSDSRPCCRLTTACHYSCSPVKRFLFPVLAGLAAAVLGLSACGSSAVAAAKVNNTVISQSSLDDELKAILHNKAYVQAIEQQ